MWPHWRGWERENFEAAVALHFAYYNFVKSSKSGPRLLLIFLQFPFMDHSIHHGTSSSQRGRKQKAHPRVFSGQVNQKIGYKKEDSTPGIFPLGHPSQFITRRDIRPVRKADGDSARITSNLWAHFRLQKGELFAAMRTFQEQRLHWSWVVNSQRPHPSPCSPPQPPLVAWG